MSEMIAIVVDSLGTEILKFQLNKTLTSLTSEEIQQLLEQFRDGTSEQVWTDVLNGKRACAMFNPEDISDLIRINSGSVSIKFE